MNTQNYESVNPACDVSQNWCLSCKFLKTMKQVTVQFSNKKKYKYISRFPVQVGDIAIIGNDFPAFINYSPVSPVESTGMIGVVTEVLPKVEIKRNYAAELDFVFSKTPGKKLVDACAQYLTMDDYTKVLQFEKYCSPVRPITHFVRRLLAASSIIANKELASTDALEAARQCIREKPQLDANQIENLEWGPPETIGVDFEQVFFTTDYSELDALLPEGGTKIDAIMDGKLFDRALSDPKLTECVAKYAYSGAFSIMARGGFLNLLRSFIDEQPLYQDFEAISHDSKAIYSCEEIKEYLQSV